MNHIKTLPLMLSTMSLKIPSLFGYLKYPLDRMMVALLVETGTGAVAESLSYTRRAVELRSNLRVGIRESRNMTRTRAVVCVLRLSISHLIFSPIVHPRLQAQRFWHWAYPTIL